MVRGLWVCRDFYISVLVCSRMQFAYPYLEPQSSFVRRALEIHLVWESSSIVWKTVRVSRKSPLVITCCRCGNPPASISVCRASKEAAPAFHVCILKWNILLFFHLAQTLYSSWTLGVSKPVIVAFALSRWLKYVSTCCSIFTISHSYSVSSFVLRGWPNLPLFQFITSGM